MTNVLQPRYISVGNRNIPYTIRRSSRAKRLQVRIARTGVEVIAPVRLAARHIEPFLLEKKHWIAEAFTRVTEPAIERSRTLFEDGSTVPFRGELQPLSVLERPGIPKSKAQVLFTDHFAVSVAPELDAEDRKRVVKRTLERWLIDRLWLVIDERLPCYSPVTGFPVQIRVKNQKRLWGSCTGRGNIALNWHLAFAPEEVIDYVLLHELCHLQQRNHGPHYWQLVLSLMPEYKDNRKWLMQNEWLRTFIWQTDSITTRKYSVR